MKTKELGWKETQGVQNTGIEDSQGNRTVQESQSEKLGELYYKTIDRPFRPEILEVDPGEEVNTDEKGPYILQSEVKNDVK